MYQSLLDMERKLDWTMTRKKVEVQDALSRVPTVRFVFGRFSSGTWLTSCFLVGSWFRFVGLLCGGGFDFLLLLEMNAWMKPDNAYLADIPQSYCVWTGVANGRGAASGESRYW